MTAAGIVAVVPVKELHRSKSRLAGVLSPGEREALSLGLMRRVVSAAAGSEACDIWVVGRDRCVESAVRELGVTWIQDEAPDLNGAVNSAFQLACDAGLTPMYLPADLPFVSPADVRGLIEVSDAGSILTLAPARRDGGTNAVLAPARSRFQLMLSTGSFRKHRAQATSLGRPVAFFDSPGIGLDVDIPEDLEIVESIAPGLISELTTR